MAKLHLAFRSIEPEVVAATETLFAAKPWREDRDSQAALAQTWLDTTTTLYGLPEIHFAFTESNVRVEYVPATGDSPAKIVANHFSLINLFWAMARHRGEFSRSGAGHNPMGWACSLFYTVRPAMFRARVREGRVVGVGVRDIYSAATWARIQSHGLDPRQADVLRTLAQINDGNETRYGVTMGLDVALSPEEELDALAALEDIGDTDDPMVFNEGGYTSDNSAEPLSITPDGEVDEDVAELVAEEAEARVSETDVRTERERLEQMTRDEVRAIARSHGILNPSSRTKPVLIDMILAARAVSA